MPAQAWVVVCSSAHNGEAAAAVWRRVSRQRHARGKGFISWIVISSVKNRLSIVRGMHLHTLVTVAFIRVASGAGSLNNVRVLTRYLYSTVIHQPFSLRLYFDFDPL